MKINNSLALFLTFLSFHALSAAESIDEYVPANSWSVGVSVGYGSLQNPVDGREDLELSAIPEVRFYGERLSIESLDVYYSIIEAMDWSFELAGSQNLDGLYFPGENRSFIASTNGIQNGFPGQMILELPHLQRQLQIHPRSLSYLVGGQLAHHGPIKLMFSYKQDVSNVHHGSEITLGFEKRMHFGAVAWELSIDLLRKSKELVSYYYAVDMSHGAYAHEFYDPNSATNIVVTSNMAFPLLENIALVSSVKYEKLGRGISRSPLVARDELLSYFFGVKVVL